LQALEGLRDAVRTGRVIAGELARVASWFFGDVVRARTIAGVPAARRGWSRTRVLDELRAHHRQNRRGLAPDLANAAARHFGTIGAARQAAGVPAIQRAWTRAMIIDALRTKWSDRSIDDGTFAAACRRVFRGGIPEARRAAGLPLLRRPVIGATSARRGR
jgi:hypothetical protein